MSGNKSFLHCFWERRPVICSLSSVSSTSSFSSHQRLLSPPKYGASRYNNALRVETAMFTVIERHLHLHYQPRHLVFLFSFFSFGCWLVGVFLRLHGWLCDLGHADENQGFPGELIVAKTFLLPPGSNPKISISNWRMDGLMLYKMTHSSRGLNWGERGPALHQTCHFSVRLADTKMDR